MSFDMVIAIPMFLLWIVICSISIIMINKKKLNKKNSLLIYTLTLVIGGILLGGIPNAVMPIQAILSSIGAGGAILLIMPMIIFLILLLITVFVFGRLFCGFACPLGAIQELASKLKFKANIKEQKSVKYKIDISHKSATIIRWIFFLVLIIFTIIWSISLLQIINPFMGFQVFMNPVFPLLLIPLISLSTIFISSFFIYRPWCRLFCPFGAVSSLVSRFSRGKYVRTDACTDCGLCEQICPTHQAERESKKDECYYCNRCVEICPVKAIKFKIE
ncbi:MAG: 4Fe-4S binding protein [Promethearchaeota archaeon]